MRILLIDDHISFCEGLQAVITTIRPDYHVDFESDSQLIPQALMRPNRYDLVIIDLVMQGLGGLELLNYVTSEKSCTPVAILSSERDVSIIEQAIRQGAVGFLPKTYSVYQIIEALDGCLRGETHIPEDLAPGILAALEKDSPAGKDSLQGTLRRRLTRRQLEIISLMDKGLSNQEIADALFIGLATVKTHIDHLFKLYKVSNRINCLRAAKKEGIS
jgi:two-component system, NarL family, response regulator LiaR